MTLSGFLFAKQRQRRASDVEKSKQIGFKLLPYLLVADLLNRSSQRLTANDSTTVSKERL